MQEVLASSGLPLYPADACSPCLEVRAALPARALGCGHVSRAALHLACCRRITPDQSFRHVCLILRRVFGGKLLASILESGFDFGAADSACSDAAALKLQPLPAFDYLRARGRVTWWQAARMCDVHALAAHIDLGADVTCAEQGSEWTVLHYAAARGNVPVMELAISCGVRVDARDCGGSSALHLAARNDRVDAANLLVACGVDVDVRGDGGRTPLHMAAHRGFCNVMRLLIARGADLAARCHEQRCALHWAAHDGHCSAINLLIHSRADVNASAGDGGTPLHLATFKGQCAAMQLLLEACADVNALQMTGAHSRDREARTPLRLALVNNRVDAAKMLRAHGGLQ